MSKLVLALGAPAAAIFALATPASAQSQQLEVIVYGDDPCPRASEDEVVVCRRRPEEDRYRIPQEFRASPPATDPARQSWAARVQYLERENVTGIPQCSAVGPAAAQGCLQQEIDEATARREALEEDETAPEQ
ncbi:hypothetical protein [Sphingomicrobium marinum]|uniref:hypothetical protein n=1 Tax=Sphingomicrobium marinum TaxID=1227950 RepID=UPI00223FBF19|nr:hypothetical protein [Sphingomicrobium marinum]